MVEIKDRISYSKIETSPDGQKYSSCKIRNLYRAMKKLDINNIYFNYRLNFIYKYVS